ncbi:MAG: hypothetical protein ACK4GJ_05090 [bacterium]
MNNVKFEIAKAKILFSSEDQEEKQQSLKIFENIFNNPNNELKYRFEALSFLIENLYSHQETYSKLLSILTQEEIDEIKSSFIIRKIKEIGGKEDLKNWVIQEVLNNTKLTATKRYYILKSALETLEIDLLQLIKDKDPDFFNIILLLKDKKEVANLLVEKIKESNYLDKLVYLNILYTLGYKFEEVINYLISENINNYFLILIFSYYFKDSKIYQKIIQKFEEENSGIFKIFVHHLVISLNTQKPSFINLDPLLGEAFHKILYSILTRDNKIIESITSELYQNYSGLYLTILSKYLYKLGLTDSIVKEDLSEIESEYLSMEDAMIEINSSKYDISLFMETIENQTEIKEEQSETPKADLELPQSQEKDETLSKIDETFESPEIKPKEKEIDTQIVEEIEKIVENIIKEGHPTEIEKTEIEKVDQYIKDFLEDKTEEIDQKVLLDFYIQDKEKFIELIEKHVLEEDYIKNNFDKIIKILQVFKEIDEFSMEFLLKNLIQTFLENELFDKLAQTFKTFKITSKVNFYNYVSKNDFINWDKDMQEKLLKLVNFFVHEDKFKTLSKEEVGILCVYILEGQFEEIKQPIGKILEEVYS